MKILLQQEEAAMTAVAVYLLTKYNLGLPVWLWVLLFFTPDIGMLGYLVNTAAGAFTYNLFHHKGLAVVVALTGYLLHNEPVIAIGVLLFGHSSFDRMMGYGLKYNDSFAHTHLGFIGKKKA
ncbi:MAG: DUF4260 domain-containing protein [Bacteroidetes bacterium]|nr:DUF4260 domain-containing protein [Bacteroidota bacterium]